MPLNPSQPPQPAHLSQEQMILAQAKSNVLMLKPRLELAQQCIATLREGLKNGTPDPLVFVIAEVQLMQLCSASAEMEDSFVKSQEVIKQIESSVKIFKPSLGGLIL
jgi:hypothetical protein